MTDSRRLVDKLWSYCNVLRDDGVGVLDYTEQLTYLLFLKMAHERATRQLKPERVLPQEYSWQRLLDAQGDQIEIEYTRMLIGLARPLALIVPISLIGVWAVVRLSMTSLRRFRSEIERRGAGDLTVVAAGDLPSEIRPVAGSSVNRLGPNTVQSRSEARR